MQRSVGRATRSIEQVQNGKINNLDEGYQFIMSPRESTNYADLLMSTSAYLHTFKLHIEICADGGRVFGFSG